MATEEQIQQMLDLMKQQMKTVNDLQAENVRLRTENVSLAASDAGAGTTSTTATTTDAANSTTANISGHHSYKGKKPDRPLINANIDDREWALFADAWGRYKKMCRLDDADVENICLELRECCSADVNKFLFEYVGPTKLDACDEQQLIAHIKSVAVKVVHKEVHRMAFNSMWQEQGEPVTQWVARLRSKAYLCEFQIPCPCCTPSVQVSYAEEEIAQRLVAGLCNEEHKRRILSESTTLTTLDLKVKRLQVLETTEQSAQSLLRPQHPPPAEASVVKSQYKAGKVTPKETVGEADDQCQWCGLTSHPGGKPLEKKSCPARQKKCSKCQKTGHFGRVCRSSAAAAVEEDGTDDVGILESGASVSFSFGTEQDFRKARRNDGEP